jgi:hypothetical protein
MSIPIVDLGPWFAASASALSRAFETTGFETGLTRRSAARAGRRRETSTAYRWTLSSPCCKDQPDEPEKGQFCSLCGPSTACPGCVDNTVVVTLCYGQ